MKKLFVPGVFDVFHVGHLNYLKTAASHGDYVIVGIQDDRYVEQCKGIKPVIPLHERVAIIQELRFVDEVVSYTDVFQGPLLDGLEIDAFACGEEYGSTDQYPDQKRTLDYCAEHGVEVVRVPRTDHVSSTQIRGQLKDFWQSRAKLKSELTAGVTTLGSFQGDQDKVRQETEHEVSLIFDAVPEPAKRSLLDLGCGDGRQLEYLAPKFQRTVGVDFSADLLQLAEQRIGDSSKSVQLVEGDVSTFVTDEKFDVILLSGITPCLDDDQVARMLQNVQRMAHGDSLILVRTSIALGDRINVVNQFSPELNARYTAFYRTIDEMRELFGHISFAARSEQQLYQHRPDSAVWWFVFEPTATPVKSAIKPPKFLSMPKVSEVFTN